MGEREIKVGGPRGDELSLTVSSEAPGRLILRRLRVIGGEQILQQARTWRERLPCAPEVLLREAPGNSSGEILLREVLARATDTWKPPYCEAELCHCRAVPTATVEAAIGLGAHTPQIVSRWTSASTACGTCRKDVEATLAYRLRPRDGGRGTSGN